MRIFKHKITILTLIVLCISSLLLFTGCKDKTEPEIFISQSDNPRLTYVQGQELDLSTGSLTFVDGEESTKVALNAEGVSVTGYNKDQLGEQTVTVTYMEKTTEIKVNVIPRVKAEGFESKYFIDDPFDKTKGKLVVARDDATTFSVNMNNDKISLVSFDSSKVGESVVTVKYTADSASYECSFNVNVYGVASVTLATPNKTAYQSHDTKLDYSGGYLTVKSTEDGGLSKFVYLTDDMISGFDITAATKENRETPLKQTITITYGGQTFTYDISITYSGVSVVNDLAKLFEGFDWEAEDATIDAEKSEATMEAINAYYKLSKAQKALISTVDTETLIRAATIVVSLKYRQEFNNYENTIKIGDDLSISLVASSYEETLVDLEKLKNEDASLNVYADILRDIVDDFPQVVIAQGKTVEQVVAVHSEDIHDFLIDIFTHLTELYELLKDIPANWTDADLKTNESKILTAINNIKSETFVKQGYNYFYTKILSKWREKDDYVDILYHYYINIKGDGANLFDAMFQKVPLPGEMDSWYNNLIEAVSQIQWMKSKEDSDAYLADVTGFMYYYQQTLKTAQEIKDSGNELYLDIFDALDVDYLHDINIISEGYGYLYQCGPMLDSERFMTLWDKYLTIVDIYVTSTLDKTKNDAEFRAVLNALGDLTPSELYGFLCSLNFRYDDARGTVTSLEYSESPGNMFIDMLGQYCVHVLNDDCEPVFKDLFLAMERYAQIDIRSTALTDFQNAMESAKTKYTALSDTDKTNFNTYFGDIYAKYLGIYEVTKGKTVDLGAYADSFEELEFLLTNYDAVYELFSSKEEGVDKDGALGLLIALYERAKVVYESIVATNDSDLISALYAKTYTAGEEDISLECGFYRVRFSVIYSYMVSMQYELTDAEEGKNLVRAWSLYAPTNVESLFADYVYVLYSQFDSTYAAPDKATMFSLMEKIRDLISNDFETVSAFCTFQGDSYYYKALRAFLAEALSDTADEIGTKLVTAEINYLSYLFSDKEEYLNSFKTGMEEIKAAYATAVTEADKEYLDAMYNYYVEIYDSLTSVAN